MAPSKVDHFLKTIIGSRPSFAVGCARNRWIVNVPLMHSSILAVIIINPPPSPRPTPGTVLTWNLTSFSKVPTKAEEITIPADVTPEKVPTHIVDYSGNKTLFCSLDWYFKLVQFDLQG